MKRNSYNPIILIGSGAFLAVAGLLINQELHVTVNLASLLSPTGSQFSISGFRVKHWLTGTLLTFTSIGLFYSNNKLSTKKLSLLILGAGLFLIFDEYEDVYRFLTTGAYP